MSDTAKTTPQDHPLFVQAVEMPDWPRFVRAVEDERRRRWEAKRNAGADHLVASGSLDMTAEGFVREWHRRGRRSETPLSPWEWAYQRAGLIEKAEWKGYIEIGRDVACTITLTQRGEALCHDE